MVEGSWVMEIVALYPAFLISRFILRLFDPKRCQATALQRGSPVLWLLSSGFWSLPPILKILEILSK